MPTPAPPRFEWLEDKYRPHAAAEVTLRADYEQLVTGLEFPSSLTVTADGRLFVAEFRTGTIKEVRADGGRFSAEPFARVPLPEQMGEEQGLWNVTAHPTAPFIYASAVTTTDPGMEFRGTWRIVRFELLPDGRAGPMEEVCGGLPSATWHNGGAMAFSPEGELYVSIGDVLNLQSLEDLRRRLKTDPAAPLGDPAQLSGAILRLHDDDCGRLATLALRDAVFALGFRNPYGITFSPDGVLFATENGPTCCDRILRVDAATDHGWPRYGALPEQLPAMQSDQAVAKPLVFTHTQSIGPTAIIFYAGDRHAELKNSLLYGTFHAGSLMRVELSADLQRVVGEEVLLTLPVQSRAEYAEAGGIVGVTAAPDGTIFFSNLDTIYRVTEVPPP